jgi:hypothetical protein
VFSNYPAKVDRLPVSQIGSPMSNSRQQRLTPHFQYRGGFLDRASLTILVLWLLSMAWD